MSVKSNVILMLEEHRGHFFSGEELAEQLSVSRAAVWKAIKQLQTEGYEIEAVTNRGYRLASDNDILSEEGIRMYLSEKNKYIPIQVDLITGSTNQNAKLCAIHGGASGSLFVANQQTQGRGRRGRSFVSLHGNSIYMSILIRPETDAANLVFITTGACVGVHRAIKKVTGIKTQIKWVNDLYYKQKKVCGILTEAVSDCETGMIDSIVIGIGINFNIESDKIPEKLNTIAGALYEGGSCDVSRNELIAEVVNQVLVICSDLNDHTFLEEYRNHSMVIGKEIDVISVTNQRKGKALGIDDRGALLVRYEDGSEEALNTGEISIRINEE